MKIVVIIGPTAVGKTALGIEIAKALKGEVISADSRQVYRGLNLGTGKATPEEMQGIPHHLIDVADPQETFSAAEYVRLGRAALDDIHARGKVPIVVGGTGFYIDSLLGRMQLANVEPNQELREVLAPLTLEALLEKLHTLDPVRYEEIDRHNRRRVERAIEIASAPPPEQTAQDLPHYETHWIGLTLPLPELKVRIHERLLARLDQGMIKEAERRHADGLSWERMEALGLEYRYLARHLQGILSSDDMIATLEKEIVLYARRQMTWFKRNQAIHWFRPEQKEEAIKDAQNFLSIR